MEKTYEKTLPENYEVVKIVDAKDKKTATLFTIGSFVICIGLLLAVLLPFDFTRLDINSINKYLIILIIMQIIYIIAHELVHGIAYKVLTKQKLTFGMTLTVAYCGVPDIYCYYKTALIAVLAPFVTFSIIFVTLCIITAQSNVNLSFIFRIITCIHISGCIGDLYVTYLLLTKYKKPTLLYNDTGPKQTFYLPKE